MLLSFWRKGLRRVERTVFNNRNPQSLLAHLLYLYRIVELILWKLTGKRIVECFGDSHVGRIREINSIFSGTGYEWRFRAVSVDGATVLGLANPNSRTNALRIFRHWMKWLRRSDAFMFCLGEVDTGFLLWLLSEKRGESVENILSNVLERYKQFIMDARAINANIYVLSAPLPTIRDGEAYGKVANARKNIKASQEERTALTLKFNHEMEGWCLNNGIIYLNLDPYSIDSSTRTVREELRNSNKFDHHYDVNAYMHLIYNVFIDQVHRMD